MQQITSFINGRHVQPTSGTYMNVYEPATGEVYAQVADSTPADVDGAVVAARRAFDAWSRTPAEARSRVLLKLAELIERELEPLAIAESRDTGKPIALARGIDIPRSAANLRFFATAILHTQGEAYEFDGGGVPSGQGGGGTMRALNYTLRTPRGVAGLISPWNLPLYLLTWKIAPALATGNTAVCKPSEVTPMTAFMLGELANQAGLPPGVLNIVQGRGTTAGAAIVTHASVPTISFTGSTGVGRWIGREAGERLKRVSLELGGKNPLVVCQDVDVEQAAALAVRAGFTNQGQICLCGSRVLVHESVADEFITCLLELVRELQIGDPADPATRFGALVSKEHREKVEAAVQRARELGARVLIGGKRPEPGTLPTRVQGGFFYPPTVLDGLDPACDVEQEEIFGPVISLQRFSSDDEAIRLANATKYGLAASVLTSNITRAQRMASEIQSGIVWVNCWLVRDLRTPFGGMHASGVGREGGSEALKFFTEVKNVCMG